MGFQRSEKKNIVFGLLLIFIGLLLFAGIFLHVNFITMHYLWPLFVLIPGLLFELSYFIERRAPGILIPGGILMTIGLLFFFEVFTNWSFSSNTWPVYIISVAVGFYQYYFFAGRSGGILFTAVLLTVIATVAVLSDACYHFFSIIPGKIIVPALFVVAGLYILFHGIGKHRP
jgi:hypothetical protein